MLGGMAQPVLVELHRQRCGGGLVETTEESDARRPKGVAKEAMHNALHGQWGSWLGAKEHDGRPVFFERLHWDQDGAQYMQVHLSFGGPAMQAFAVSELHQVP
jgi:hypothetical protein